MSKGLVLIPARYESSRFPGKPLVPLLSKSMIRHVFENMLQSSMDVYVVTDNQKIEDHVRSFTDKVLRVDDDVSTGTDRIYLAYQRFFQDQGYDYICNVQGDEPLLQGQTLLELMKFHQQSRFDVTTLIRPVEGHSDDFNDPNIVKSVYDEITGSCLYFSRSPVPYDRDGKSKCWYQHIGVYLFKASALEEYMGLKKSEIENIEALEQLRALSGGMSIGAIKTKEILIGVDLPKDVIKVEAYLSGKA